MEACCYASSRESGPNIFFLITKDYKFFRTFIRSPYVEGILKSTATKILGIPRAVDVKLAGEIMPNLDYTYMYTVDVQ